MGSALLFLLAILVYSRVANSPIIAKCLKLYIDGLVITYFAKFQQFQYTDGSQIRPVFTQTA